LHRLLIEVEGAGRADIISFVSNGCAFQVHKPDKFFKDVVPLYFRQSRLSSFKRQLNLYGFELINTGPARGAYFHELFIKDQPELCRRMRRVAVKLAVIENVGHVDEINESTEHLDVQQMNAGIGDFDF
jgi:HSF-type DNA-binding